MSRQRVGWFLLNRGRGPVFHGVIPDGAIETTAPGIEAAAPAPERPADKAPKADWVAYAETLGVDSSGTKAAIIARCGDQGVDSGDGGAQVDPVPLGDEELAQVEELADGEPRTDALDDDPDVLGHED